MNQPREPEGQGIPWFRPLLLIIIGMVLGGIALGLGVSALWEARGPRSGGARSSSANNLYQLGRALQNFESAVGRLPPAIGGTPALGAGVIVDHPKGLPGTYSDAFPFAYLNTHGFLLPYMEQDPIFNSMRVVCCFA